MRGTLRPGGRASRTCPSRRTRRFFAQMLLDRDGPGDRAKAVTLVGEAADLYRQMGMPRHLEMVEAMLP